jgi:hypothetical protein
MKRPDARLVGSCFANSGVDRVVEWNAMYFFLGDDGHVEEGPFSSLDDVLGLPYPRSRCILS